MPLLYADTSALVKLVLDEPESPVLRTYLNGADLISCELVVERDAARDPAAPRRRIRRCRVSALLARTGELLDAIGLLAIDRELLLAAGTLAEPSLRALDAIEIAAAISAAALAPS